MQARIGISLPAIWLSVGPIASLRMGLAGAKMQQAELEIGRLDHQQEAERVAALLATGILDTPPEAGYDAITRLAAEYFQADSAGLGFADESRVWIKSSWGLQARELPRKNSIFDLVLAEDGPVVVSGFSQTPQLDGLC